jgi:hypothetical protein
LIKKIEISTYSFGIFFAFFFFSSSFGGVPFSFFMGVREQPSERDYS